MEHLAPKGPLQTQDVVKPLERLACYHALTPSQPLQMEEGVFFEMMTSFSPSSFNLIYNQKAPTKRFLSMII